MDKTLEYLKAAKRLTAAGRFGLLSSISVSQAGFPFGSLVPYDLLASGQLVIYISLIAEHYRNLKADNRASITVVERFADHDPQAYSRATVLLNFDEVSANERESIQERYEARFPSSINYEIAHNFVFLKGTAVKVRWIGGFGAIAWLDGNKFVNEPIDPVSYVSFDIVDHMNNDHQDALDVLARAYSSDDVTGSRIVMASINSTQCVLRVIKGNESTDLILSFPQPVTTTDEVRKTVVTMVKEARAKLN